MDPKKNSNIFIFRLRVCAFFVAPQKGFNAVSKLERKIVLDAARKNVAKRTAFAGSASG